MAQLPSPPAKFQEVYGMHHAAIRDYCFRRLAPADANDAAAEVFVVVWKKIDAVPGGNGTLPYLYGIARNIVANQKRSLRRRGRLDGKLSAQPPKVQTGPEAQVVQREEVQRVLDALDELNDTDQELLRLKAWEKLSSAEIAEVTGLTVRAVETRLSRARKKLTQRAAKVRTRSVAGPPLTEREEVSDEH